MSKASRWSVAVVVALCSACSPDRHTGATVEGGRAVESIAEVSVATCEQIGGVLPLYFGGAAPAVLTDTSTGGELTCRWADGQHDVRLSVGSADPNTPLSVVMVECSGGVASGITEWIDSESCVTVRDEGSTPDVHASAVSSAHYLGICDGASVLRAAVSGIGATTTNAAEVALLTDSFSQAVGCGEERPPLGGLLFRSIVRDSGSDGANGTYSVAFEDRWPGTSATTTYDVVLVGQGTERVLGTGARSPIEVTTTDLAAAPCVEVQARDPARPELPARASSAGCAHAA